ncbi:SGNH/GDSL hydrolase family protein [Rugamonas sp. CCM 8940]|uniref:SGNH/GDSL hydrolase family protein n=1 Tax=Rugamonas sp. CCM 8940 TaxID=2765359 RepID=UPI0018F53BD9|nr:SGNH/GDSL hydrolase family protein [Rugamonas sp. CCM 8940]MBJ7313389.1 SGNH/GDSL hydrolase family protein [Rugamonas sp. CCM 8940]
MRPTPIAFATLALALLASCGGGVTSPDENVPKISFSSQVTFGDSLSDVGTYAVGKVRELGGGTYNINGDNRTINAALTGKNWTELMASRLGQAAPCAAQTGLDGDDKLGYFVPVVNHAGCFGYAQGGARVSNPVGSEHKATGSALGQLTVPAATQIRNHLAAVGGRFKGDEIVFVMAGGNDLLALLRELQSGAGKVAADAGAAAFADSLVKQLAAGASDVAAAMQAVGAALAAESARAGHTADSVVGAAVLAAAGQPGNAAVGAPAVYGPLVLKAKADGEAAGAKAGADYAALRGPAMVATMAATGKELVALVKEQLLAKGANYVTVNNLPDVATSPAGLLQPAASRQLIMAMVGAFNGELSTGLAGEAKVLLVDVYAISHDQASNPAAYGLSNVKEMACDLEPLKNALHSSLVCNGGNLAAGDVSHYAFADDVHPTPYNYLLLARHVAEKMVLKGWL